MKENPSKLEFRVMPKNCLALGAYVDNTLVGYIHYLCTPLNEVYLFYFEIFGVEDIFFCYNMPQAIHSFYTHWNMYTLEQATQ